MPIKVIFAETTVKDASLREAIKREIETVCSFPESEKVTAEVFLLARQPPRVDFSGDFLLAKIASERWLHRTR